MRIATYLVAGLASLAWGLPILAAIIGVVSLYQSGFGSLAAITGFIPTIALPGIGLLFSLLVPRWLWSRGRDSWALGTACLSLGIVLVIALLGGNLSEPNVSLAVPSVP
jgi:hypothetical protein